MMTPPSAAAAAAAVVFSLLGSVHGLVRPNDVVCTPKAYVFLLSGVVL